MSLGTRARRNAAGTGPSAQAAGPVPWLVRAVDSAIATLSKTILTVMTVVLFLAIFINVVLRYIFASGIPGAYELPAILFPWLVICGAVIAAQRGQHIAVDLVLRGGPPALRITIRIAINLAIVALAVVVVQAGWVMMTNSWSSRLAETGLSEGWGFMSLVYGYAAIGLTALTGIYRTIFGPVEPMEAERR